MMTYPPGMLVGDHTGHGAYLCRGAQSVTTSTARGREGLVGLVVAPGIFTIKGASDRGMITQSLQFTPGTEETLATL